MTKAIASMEATVIVGLISLRATERMILPSARGCMSRWGFDDWRHAEDFVVQAGPGEGDGGSIEDCCEGGISPGQDEDHEEGVGHPGEPDLAGCVVRARPEVVRAQRQFVRGLFHGFVDLAVVWVEVTRLPEAQQEHQRTHCADRTEN